MKRLLIDLKSLDKFGSFGTFTRIGYQIMKNTFTTCKPTNNLVSNSTHNLVLNSMAIIKLNCEFVHPLSH